MPDDPRNPHDTRTQREKLEAMARQKESPREAEVARHMLFKRYGGGKKEAPKRESLVGASYDKQHGQMEHDDFMSWFGKRRGRVVKTQDDVLSAFLRGDTARSRATHVPGGRRQRVEISPDEEGGFDLFSYNTVVARRHADKSISVTPRRYSVTTSKMMGRLARMMDSEGYAPSGESRKVRAKVPGRWGGWGPAWHETGWEDLPFIHHVRTGMGVRKTPKKLIQ